MDNADRSDERIQGAVDEGIAKARRELEHSLIGCGSCYWCESPVGPARVFCSTECSQSWQHDQKRRRELGL